MDIEQWIPDYEGSDHFLFLDSSIKGVASEILSIFAQVWKSSLQNQTIQHSLDLENVILTTLNRLNLSSNIKLLTPNLISQYFEYLGQSGQAPQASEWSEWARSLEQSITSKIRLDGSLKGTTHQKKTNHTGRNEPCPCGSGKKFKKCCLNLIS